MACILGQQLTEDEQMELLQWVDTIPLSRPKRSLARDFADGVLMAEVVHHYFPRLVELHNYSAAHNTAQKLYNWSTLNSRVFKRLGFSLPKEVSEAMAACEPGAAERVLRLVRAKMAKFQEAQAIGGDSGGTSRAGSRAAGATQQPAAVASSSACGPYPEQQLAVGDVLAALSIAGGSTGVAAAGPSGAGRQSGSLDTALRAALADREQQLSELRETNEILETKVHKLETLVRLKDAKIQALLQKMAEAAGGGFEAGGEGDTIPALHAGRQQ